MDSSSKPPSKRGKKACTECRQQKAKCDAYLDLSRPCSRCVKVNARCVISDPFKRENKRQRLSNLQQEAEELRRKLRASQSSENIHSSPMAMLTAAAELGEHPTSNGPAAVHLPSVSAYPLPHAYSSSQEARVETATVRRNTEPTTSRTLNGVTLTGEEVDDIFQLFFNHYARFLPLFDPHTSPNSYYAQSPFLFWTVIGVACRNYSQNPTLLTALRQSISEMALLTVASTAAPWHNIKGLLLMLTWPFPKDVNYPDITFPLSGMLLHIAMQNALHIPMSSHEFSRVKIPALSEADMIRRSELWAHCIIVYKLTCVCKGQCANPLVNFEQDPGEKQVLFHKIDPSLLLKVKCQEIVAKCSAAALENGMRNMSADQERALDILLRNFESQANDLEAQVISEDDKLHTTYCRMSILALHFFKNHTLVSTGCLPRIVNTACAVVEQAEGLGRRLNAISTAPMYVSFGVLIALVSLLRILKSSASRGIDAERAKSCLFKGINLAKQMSVGSTDLAAKTVVILNQLWHSTKAFRKSDGSEYTTLRIRSRLVLSPVLDAVWWWRDEFDAQYRAMLVSQWEPDGVENSREHVGATAHAPVCQVERSEPLFDDQFLEDFEWALGDDSIFPLMEPYTSAW
ncbi:hypothetical protein MAP00_006338 [Monascus purpureus]|nr:hypothetical protein MAP00_006338 [Monascus purpureus]